MTEDEYTLPCDVKVGHITFRKGCKLSTLANRTRAWFEIANNSPVSHTIQAETIRKFCGDDSLN